MRARSSCSCACGSCGRGSLPGTRDVETLIGRCSMSATKSVLAHQEPASRSADQPQIRYPQQSLAQLRRTHSLHMPLSHAHMRHAAASRDEQTCSDTRAARKSLWRESKQLGCDLNFRRPGAVLTQPNPPRCFDAAVGRAHIDTRMSANRRNQSV